MVPEPFPEAPLVIDIHPRSDVAAHAQLAAAVTVMTLPPPPPPNDKDEGESVYAQGGGVGATGELLLQAAAMIPTASRISKRHRRDEVPISVS